MDTCLFLASNEASFFSGLVLRVEGVMVVSIGSEASGKRCSEDFC